MSITEQRPKLTEQAAVSIVTTSLDRAAALVLAEQANSHKRHGDGARCLACGRRLGPLTTGHIYLIIGFTALLLISLVGALSK